MTDNTLFADVSEFQVAVNDLYPHRFFSFRANDGTYRDANFHANLAWAKHAADSGRIDGFIVYFVFEDDWRDAVQTFIDQIGKPHPRMAVMIDVESWQGKIAGDHSAEINACRRQLIKWLRANAGPLGWGRIYARLRRRVIGYGNASDLVSLWPSRGDARVVLANYSANPDFPGKIAHQFSSTYNTPPFGACDINSADGMTPAQFADALGLGGNLPVNKKPRPAKKPKPRTHRATYTVRAGDTFASIAHAHHVSLAALVAANPKVKNPSRIYPGDVIQLP